MTTTSTSCTTYVTVAIPYVNADPHLGYAFELVEADVFARACRARGERVRFLGGTDDHSLKNVLAAASAGLPTADFVAVKADRFAALAGPLGLSFDDFLRTSTDPRHQPGVERLWRACAAAGDLYLDEYAGRYCVGCEEFRAAGELVEGRCPEHGIAPDDVAERNWFFRLSRHADELAARIESGSLAITPAPYRDEVLAFIRRGLTDISVSRSGRRAGGWGIPVPDDPEQVVYVWFDALTNYLSALDYGAPASAEYATWWSGADRRIHVVGRGIVRFHAVYWPAFLLSAGLPLPTEVHVHPYLTADGAKLSKSRGRHVDPVDLVERYGTDRVRWWLARATSAVADTDFTEQRLAGCADEDLAHGVGNVVNRVVSLVHRYHGGVVPDVGAEPIGETSALPAVVAGHLATFGRRQATSAIVDAVAALNRDVDAHRPWQLAADPGRGEELAGLLDGYHQSARLIAEALVPIVPELRAACAAQLTAGPAGMLPEPRPVVARLRGARPVTVAASGRVPIRAGSVPSRELDGPRGNSRHGARPDRQSPGDSAGGLEGVAGLEERLEVRQTCRSPH
jgi:methionyl-tRNA synthetase